MLSTLLFIIIPFLSLTPNLYILSKSFDDQNFPLTPFSNLSPYNAYSSVLKSLSTKECYTPRKILRKDRSTMGDFDTPFFYDGIISTLCLSNLTFNPEYVLTSNKLMKFLQSNEEDDLSISFFYFKANYSEIENIYNKKSITTLFNDKGRELYKSKDPNFYIICGDYLIDSYYKGVALIVAVQVSFQTSEARNNFKLKSSNVGSLQSILSVIENILSNMNTKGKISISYIQIGGNDSKIKDETNKISKTCDFSKIQNDCKEIIEKIVYYSENDLKTQYENFPLSREVILLKEISKLEYFESESDRDNKEKIELPSIPITSEIAKYQNFFLDIANKYKYYQKHFTSFLNYYPIDSEVIRKFLKESDQLIKELNTTNCLLKCFKEFDDKSCEEIYVHFTNELKESEIEENYKKTLDSMKLMSKYPLEFKDDLCLSGKLKWDGEYYVNIYLFPNGNGKGVYVFTNEFEISGQNEVGEDDDFSIELIDGPFKFNINVHTKKNNNIAEVSCKEKEKGIKKSFTVTKEEQNNPYYFSPYKKRDEAQITIN